VCLPARAAAQSCQRYWTAGGTLRNVPPGAGRRKNKNGLGEEEEEDEVDAVAVAYAQPLQPLAAAPGRREGSSDGSGTDAVRGPTPLPATPLAAARPQRRLHVSMSPQHFFRATRAPVNSAHGLTRTRPRPRSPFLFKRAQEREQPPQRSTRRRTERTRRHADAAPPSPECAHDAPQSTLPLAPPPHAHAADMERAQLAFAAAQAGMPPGGAWFHPFMMCGPGGHAALAAAMSGTVAGGVTPEAAAAAMMQPMLMPHAHAHAHVHAHDAHAAALWQQSGGIGGGAGGAPGAAAAAAAAAASAAVVAAASGWSSGVPFWAMDPSAMWAYGGYGPAMAAAHAAAGGAAGADAGAAAMQHGNAAATMAMSQHMAAMAHASRCVRVAQPACVRACACDVSVC
jgi:hypothetical protein